MFCPTVVRQCLMVGGGLKKALQQKPRLIFNTTHNPRGSPSVVNIICRGVNTKLTLISNGRALYRTQVLFTLFVSKLTLI